MSVRITAVIGKFKDRNQKYYDKLADILAPHFCPDGFWDRRLLSVFLVMAMAVVIGMYLTPPEEIKGYWYVNPITRFPDFVGGGCCCFASMNA